MKIACRYYSREHDRHGLCSLGHHDGTPWAGQCLRCIADGRNRRFAVGNVLARVIGAATDAKPCSRCQARAARMTRWGWWASLTTHRAEVLGWLTDEARRRGHKIGRRQIISLIIAAAKEVIARLR